MKNEKRVDKLSLRFDCKTVSLVYPDSKINPIYVQYTFEWDEEEKLYDFFYACDCVYDVELNRGMTADVITISFKYDTPDETIKEICEKAIELMWDSV